MLRRTAAILVLLAGIAFGDSGARAQQAAADGRRTDRYGDPLPEGAIARCGTIRWRHVGAFFTAYGRDGKTLLSVGQREARSWELTTGRVIRRIDTGPTENDVAAISKDGKLLAIVKEWHDIKVLDIKAGKEILSLRQSEGSVVSMAFSPDGQHLAARCQGESRPLVWRLVSKGSVKPFEEVNEDNLEDFFGGFLFESHSVVFSADGKHLATASERGAVAVWDVATGKLVRQVKARSGGPPVIAYSPDGKLLAWGHKERGIVLTDAGTGKELRALHPPEGSARCLTFSPDSKRLVGVFDDLVQLWEVSSGRAMHKLQGDLWAIKSVAFSPDGKTLAAAGDCQIRQWSAATGEERRSHQDGVGPMYTLALSPDGKTVATGSSDGAVRLWEESTGKPTGRRFDRSDNASLVEFSPDGKTLALCRGYSWRELALCDVATGKERSLDVDDESALFALAFSPDGRKLIGSDDCNVRIFDAATGQQVRHFEVPLMAKNRPGIFLASDAGSLAAYQSYEAQGREVFGDRLFATHEIRDGIASDGAISPDGRMLALVLRPIKRVGEEQVFPDRDKPPDIVIYELTTGHERVRFKAHGPDVHPLRLSQSGGLLAYGDEDSIRVYEVSRGRELLELRGHQGSITGIVFSQDEKKLVSAGIDTTALVWDISPPSGMKPPTSQRLDRAQLQALWSELAGPDASKAYRAIRTLAAAPGSVPFLERELLALARSFPKRKEQVERLIPLLDSEQFEQREHATRKLKDFREDAELLLRGVLSGEPSAEVRRRVSLILQGMQGEPPSAEILRGMRAIEALEHAGSFEARRVLQSLADGPVEARLTREAKASLERLEKRAAK